MTRGLTEQEDVLVRFAGELGRPTGDGANKRTRGEKPPWYADTHEAQIFSHITKWKRGETVDPDSGAHPLVHAAWRCLAIACIETGNVPERTVCHAPFTGTPYFADAEQDALGEMRDGDSFSATFTYDLDHPVETWRQTSPWRQNNQDGSW